LGSDDSMIRPDVNRTDICAPKNLVPYFSIDNERIVYTKCLNSLKRDMHSIHLKGMRGKPNVRFKYYLIFIEH
jgi:hypothetical protein